MRSIIALVSLFGLISAGGYQQQEQLKNFLWISIINQCEGKDSSNYTLVDSYQLTSNCDTTSILPVPKYMIACSPTGEKSVITLENLAQSSNSAGAYGVFEALLLGTSGPLEGKWIYLRQVFLLELYLKKCSSVLGLSYVPSSSTYLIADKIDKIIFLNPGGAFEAMKKLSSTICKGTGYTV